ncbi:hypothetical protein SS50377_20237 [Spironucleus salmonicida]|uniref:Uncharacterized protein n=1 Tax=Spironucleus salmonicida TaxID=348837 RepID=A0A9P8S1N1_9EUKA|nr:hypothetical protein SS50377_20237 [Spironucleus salmonicida]
MNGKVLNFSQLRYMNQEEEIELQLTSNFYRSGMFKSLHYQRQQCTSFKQTKEYNTKNKPYINQRKTAIESLQFYSYENRVKCAQLKSKQYLSVNTKKSKDFDFDLWDIMFEET